MGIPVVQGEAILELLPQREPMVMVDSFYGIADGCSYSGLAVLASNIFCDGCYLQETGVIEHIAQSAAARVGYLCSQSKQPVPLGFIGAVDKLSIYRLPAVGDCLRTEIRIVQEVMNITLAEASVSINGECIAECKLKIVLDS